jgi:cytochrome c-type biogenesis protein CcmE
MTRKAKRLTLIFGALAVLGLAAGLIMFALRDNIVFFYTPTQLAEKHPATGARLRIGGLVKQGSLVKGEGRDVSFVITDNEKELAATYTGLLPDLFREGQGVVADGVLASDGKFRADSVLAKHDETYMPKEVAEALKKQGHWKEEGAGRTDETKGKAR